MVVWGEGLKVGTVKVPGSGGKLAVVYVH